MTPSNIAALPPSLFWAPEDFRKSSWSEHVPFAFWIVEALRPRSVVELGTWYGMSYLAFCQAMKRLRVDGRAMAVDTWQGDHQTGGIEADALVQLRRSHDPKYSGFSTLQRSTFEEALGKVADGSVDLLHIDGLHTYEAVRHDFETWLPKMSERGVVLFHDTQETHQDFGVYRLWAELAERYPSFEFAHEHGLGVLGVGTDLPVAVRDLFDAARDEADRDRVRNVFHELGRKVRVQEEANRLGESLGRINGVPGVMAAKRLYRRIAG